MSSIYFWGAKHTWNIIQNQKIYHISILNELLTISIVDFWETKMLNKNFYNCGFLLTQVSIFMPFWFSLHFSERKQSKFKQKWNLSWLFEMCISNFSFDQKTIFNFCSFFFPWASTQNFNKFINKGQGYCTCNDDQILPPSCYGTVSGEETCAQTCLNLNLCIGFSIFKVGPTDYMCNLYFHVTTHKKICFFHIIFLLFSVTAVMVNLARGGGGG